MSRPLALILAILLSFVTVGADIFIKKASLQDIIWNRWLLFGALTYALTAAGWVFVMREVKLATLGVVYGVSCIVLLTLVSAFFGEKLVAMEVVGIAFGIMSVLMLYRFA